MHVSSVYTWNLKWRASYWYNSGKSSEFLPASCSYFVHTTCSVAIRPSLGSNCKSLYQILAKKYIYYCKHKLWSTSWLINSCWSWNSVVGSYKSQEEQQQAKMSVLSSHQEDTSNLDERFLQFFSSPNYSSICWNYWWVC